VAGLTVHQENDEDVVWESSMKKSLNFCVSDTFGSRHNQVVTAMNSAAGAWEAVADIDFHHVSAQDGNCTASNNSVVFDVRR
jgi:hypothetical protein